MGYLPGFPLLNFQEIHLHHPVAYFPESYHFLVRQGQEIHDAIDIETIEDIGYFLSPERQ